MSGGLTLLSDVWDVGELSFSDEREFLTLERKSLRTTSNGVTDAISCRFPSCVCRPRTTPCFVGLCTAMFTLWGDPRGKVSSCSETSKSAGYVASRFGSNSTGVLLSSGPQSTRHGTITDCPCGTVMLFLLVLKTHRYSSAGRCTKSINALTLSTVNSLKAAFIMSITAPSLSP